MSRTRYSPTAVSSVERFHINHFASTTRVIVWLVIDLLTLKQVRIIARGWATFVPIMLFLGLFVLDLWVSISLSDAPPDIATLTFDLGGHGARR